MKISELEVKVERCQGEFNALGMQQAPRKELELRVEGLLALIKGNQIEDMSRNNLAKIQKMGSQLETIASKLKDLASPKLAPKADFIPIEMSLYPKIESLAEVKASSKVVPPLEAAKAEAKTLIKTKEAELEKSLYKSNVIFGIAFGAAVIVFPLTVVGGIMALVAFPPLGWTLIAIGVSGMVVGGVTAIIFHEIAESLSERIKGSQRTGLWSFNGYSNEGPWFFSTPSLIGTKEQAKYLEDPDFISFAEKIGVKRSEDLLNHDLVCLYECQKLVGEMDQLLKKDKEYLENLKSGIVVKPSEQKEAIQKMDDEIKRIEQQLKVGREFIKKTEEKLKIITA